MSMLDHDRESVAHPSCDADDHGCITCSDRATPVRVLAVRDAGIAECVDEDGERSEILTALVGSVAVGDRLLVHAGTALLRLEAGMEDPR